LNQCNQCQLIKKFVALFCVSFNFLVNSSSKCLSNFLDYFSWIHIITQLKNYCFVVYRTREVLFYTIIWKKVLLGHTKECNIPKMHHGLLLLLAHSVNINTILLFYQTPQLCKDQSLKVLSWDKCSLIFEEYIYIKCPLSLSLNKVLKKKIEDFPRDQLVICSWHYFILRQLQKVSLIIRVQIQFLVPQKDLSYRVGPVNKIVLTLQD
jgi:hypothetical protein